MMNHYCSSCGAYSWHDDGTPCWAIECPECGHVEAQNPHPPEGFTGTPVKASRRPAGTTASKRRPAKKAAAKRKASSRSSATRTKDDPPAGAVDSRTKDDGGD